MPFPEEPRGRSCPGAGPQTGNRNAQLRITKTGNTYLRRMLVSCAQYVLGPFGPDCDLRRWGLRLAERGGKSAKKRAVVTVARKVAILLHRLWAAGEIYRPSLQPAAMTASAPPCRPPFVPAPSSRECP